MPTPTTSSLTSPITLTGQNAIDSLLWLSQWGTGAGTGISLTYSFPSGTPTWDTSLAGYSGVTSEITAWSALGTGAQSAFVSALGAWSNVANVTFTPVAETATAVGDIRVAYTTAGIMTPNVAAYAYLPNGSAMGGDIWLNPSQNASPVSSFEAAAPGTYGYFAMMHELGHSLGFKHPFDATVVGNPNVLPANLDSYWNTIMSYSVHSSVGVGGASFYPTTPMSLDIQAMQYLYGPSVSHAGNDTYVFNGNSNYLQTIWDSGGIDTIQYASATGGLIDLNPGAWSQLGLGIRVWNSSGIYVTTEYNTVNIYQTVTIENATGGSGADTILGNSVANCLDGGAGNDAICGGAGNDTMYGGAGNDTFDGNALYRAGNDVFYGGLGNDTYFFDSVGDTVIENSGEGVDTVWVGFSYSLAGLPFIENCRAYGATSVVLTGNSSNNILQGAAGADTLSGGAGNDIYVVNVAGDVVIEALNSGVDTIQSSVSYTLANRANVENLTLTGALVINAVGNALGNTLTGNAAANTLIGAQGNDVLSGAAGNDILVGGTGTDRMTGGVGADIFRFTSTADSLAGLTQDVITDFCRGVDKIDLSLIDANAMLAGNQAFSLIAGVLPFTAAGQIKFAGGMLYANTDANCNTSELQITLTGGASLAVTDVLL